MIGFCDTETTGLPRALGIDQRHHPYITEICIAVVNEETREIEHLMDQLIKPPIPIPGLITKITGIDDLTVYGEPPIEKVLDDIELIFMSLDRLIMQNWTFDIRMLEIESKRHHMKITRPPAFCMAEQTTFFKGRRMRQGELYEMAFPGEEYEAHRAKGDVLAMMRLYSWLIKNYPDAEGG